MNSLFSAYERSLKRMAEQRPSRRLNALYAAVFPWVALVAVILLAERVLGLSRQLEMAVLLPLTGVAIIGVCYTGSRITAYGWRFDRTPPAAPWTETANGRMLIQALRRVTLNGLSRVTLDTKLRGDLRLTSEDMSELFSVLAKEGGLDALALSPQSDVELTIEALLDGMSSAG